MERVGQYTQLRIVPSLHSLESRDCPLRALIVQRRVQIRAHIVKTGKKDGGERERERERERWCLVQTTTTGIFASRDCPFSHQGLSRACILVLIAGLSLACILASWDCPVHPRIRDCHTRKQRKSMVVSQLQFKFVVKTQVPSFFDR
jgi:hypothetical protein